MDKIMYKDFQAFLSFYCFGRYVFPYAVSHLKRNFLHHLSKIKQVIY